MEGNSSSSTMASISNLNSLRGPLLPCFSIGHFLAGGRNRCNNNKATMPRTIDKRPMLAWADDVSADLLLAVAVKDEMSRLDASTDAADD